MLKVSFQWKNSDKICLCSHWAAGVILPPFCVYARRVAAFAARGKVNQGISITFSDCLKKFYSALVFRIFADTLS